MKPLAVGIPKGKAVKICSFAIGMDTHYLEKHPRVLGSASQLGINPNRFSLRDGYAKNFNVTRNLTA